MSEELIADIEKYLQSTNATLRGKSFDVGRPEGRRDYAEWLAGEMAAFAQHAGYELKPRSGKDWGKKPRTYCNGCGYDFTDLEEGCDACSDKKVTE